MTRRLATLLVLLLAGCAAAPRHTTEPGLNETIAQPPRQASYQAEPGRDEATIAQMRAAPAPTAPTLEDGADGNESRLTAQGYVKIGTGYFPVGLIDRDRKAAANDAAMRKGQDVGAERVLLYPPRGDDNAAWVAVYFVRFKLPFGATFRDLRAEERQQLGSSGVEIGAVIGGTPASRANLIAGDFVLEVDGKPVADRAAFQSALKRNAGRSVTLTVVRNGERLQRVVRLGAIPGT
jgi:hypothetical protein